MLSQKNTIYNFIFYEHYTFFELLFPEIVLIFCIFSLLFLKPKNKSNYTYWFFELWKYSIIILLIYFFFKIIILYKYITLNFFFFNNYFLEDNFSIILKLILIFCIIITLSFSFLYYISVNNKKNKIRFLFFLLFTIFFLFCLLMAFDLFSIYLCIEGLTLVLTILISSKLSRISIESGLKYILLSAFTSCFLLLSISLFLFFFGTTNFLTLKILSNSTLLNTSLVYNSLSTYVISRTFNYLVIFFFFNLFFKLAVWPCCLWVPDIYYGLTLPLLFYFSTTIKFIFFLFFIRFITFTFFSYYFFIKLLFIIIAFSTSFFGIIGSLFQNKLKLFLAFSSITHIGLLFFSLSNFNFIGIFSAIFYLIFYTISIFLLFGILLNLDIFSYHKTWGVQKLPILYISDFKGIFFKQKFLGFCLIFIFFFLSGVPPFISFFGKFWIYITLFLDKQYFLLLCLFFLSIISTFYYLWWIRSFIFDIDKKNYLTMISFNFLDHFDNKYLFNKSWYFYIKIIKYLFFLIFLFLFFFSPIFITINIKYILYFSKKVCLVLQLF